MTFTIAGRLRFEGEPIKGSRFIVDAAPAATEEQARNQLQRVTADFPDASHHCWAWRIASPAIDRASDDGEPSGSAGRPILAQLTGRDLLDTAVIVTRYFGGTKLGVGGLVRAYGGAAGQALDTARLVPWIATTTVTLKHDYAATDSIERAVIHVRGSFLSRDFGEQVNARVELPADAVDTFASMIADATGGSVSLDVNDD